MYRRKSGDIIMDWESVSVHPVASFSIHTSSSSTLAMTCRVIVSVYMIMIMLGKKIRKMMMTVERKALLWVHSPSVQLSVASLFPSHILPRCLGTGELHSRVRCLSH